MKRIVIVLLLLMALPLVVLAAGEKTELTAAATVPGASDYVITGELLIPAFGSFLIGPNVSVHGDGDLTTGGISGEFRLGKRSGILAGAAATYLLKDSEGDREAAIARAGYFSFVGDSGLVKAYVERIVYGRGKDEADTTGVLALGLRF